VVKTGFTPSTDTALDERVEERTVPTDEGDHERVSHPDLPKRPVKTPLL